MFELYASGQCSLDLVWKTLKLEFAVALSKSHVEKLLKNPFYVGNFYWDGILYPGTHEPLVSRSLFDQVQAVFQGHNQPK
jgi:site-specific DNA recombinase